MNNYENEYLRWKNSGELTAEERRELEELTDAETKALRFSGLMDFGTAGLRSTMYMGPGCMNRFTVAHTTRGVAALVREAGGAERGVVIAYDSRNKSEEFARVSACVLAAAGIRVYLFESLRPTPELSFAVCRLHTVAGINITASHNPKEYNGYKLYWEDGAQIGPEQARTVCRIREEFDVLSGEGIADYETALREGKITLLGEETDEEYISAVLKTAVNPQTVKDVAEELKVVYTPLHGAGAKLVPEVLRRLGVKHLFSVPEQTEPDGNFPTVVKPNPEYPAAFELGIRLANEVGSDLIVATDPDSDRCGVMIRDSRGGNGEFRTVTGNQMGALLLDYIIRAKRETGTLPKEPYCVKSIVSTDMAAKIAETRGVKLYDVLTGFKFIGETVKKNVAAGNKDGFLLGFEESYGYLGGDYARDKDAVEAAMLIIEMTAYYRKQGKNLADALEELYATYGRYGEKLIDVYMEGLDGIAKRKALTDGLRKEPPKEIGGVAVTVVGDYLRGENRNVRTGEITPTGLPSSDVLYFTLENGDKIVVRPSGTEPKVKMYLLAHAETEAELTAKLNAYHDGILAITRV